MGSAPTPPPARSSEATQPSRRRRRIRRALVVLDRLAALLERRYALRAWFWNEPLDGKKGALLNVGRLVLLTRMAYTRNRLSTHASGLSFFFLLAVVPYVTFLLGVLNIFGISAWLRPHILRFVAGGNVTLVPTIDQFIQNARSVTLGGVGTAFTLALGYMVLQRVKSTLNLIWHVHKPSGLRHRLLEYFIVLALVPLLLTLAFGVSALFATETVRIVMPDVMMGMAPSRITATFTGYVVLAVVLFSTYFLLPDAQVAWRPALVAALVGAAGISLVQHYSVLLLVVLSRQSLMYGALALLPFVMTWFYLAWLILLGAAQLAYSLQHYRDELIAYRHGE